MDWLIPDSDILYEVPLAAILIILATILTIRLYGLRSFAKMSGTDFAVTIAVGSILGATVIGSAPVLSGALATFSLISLQTIISYFRNRSEAFENVVSNEPLLLMDGEEILWDNMKAARISDSDLRSKLREANVIQLSQVKAVILEATGDVSVLHTKDDIEVDDFLLEEVRRNPDDIFV